MQPKSKTGNGGRPPKFREPRRSVTMILPERILDQLAEIDPDRTWAVVKVTEAAVGTDKGRFKPVELVEMSPGKSKGFRWTEFSGCQIIGNPSKKYKSG